MDKLSLTTDPVVACDAINNHDHTAVGTLISTAGIADLAVTVAKLATMLTGINAKLPEGEIDVSKLKNLNTLGNTAANSPAYYQRDIAFKANTTRTIISPNRLWTNIGTLGYYLEVLKSLSVDNRADWDTKATTWLVSHAYVVGDCVVPINPNNYIYRCTTAGISSALTPTWPTTLGATYNDGNVVWICQLDFTVPANRKGKDFYIYATVPATGNQPGLCLSDNSTIPNAYAALSSRKIAGFHCLCADVGTIATHPLSGYIAGDILPASVWDLSHRPISSPEGMVYDTNTDRWVDVYLASIQSGKLDSVYNAPTADGASSPVAFHWYNGTDWLSKIKKNLLTQREFVSASLGSNQGTNVLGGTDPNTTGGHTDTANRRMISNIGCEDMCGVLWQWGSEAGGLNTGGTWINAFDGNDLGVGGQHYDAPCRVLLGGSWNGGAYCGSRSSYWDDGPLHLYANDGLRGCAEPLRGA